MHLFITKSMDSGIELHSQCSAARTTELHSSSFSLYHLPVLLLTAVLGFTPNWGHRNWPQKNDQKNFIVYEEHRAWKCWKEAKQILSLDSPTILEIKTSANLSQY